MLSGIKASQYTIKTEEKENRTLAFQLIGPQGDQNSSILTKEINDQLSILFNGAPKYVPRSSGGLSLVKPTPVLHVHYREDGKAEFRIKVVFRELERDQQHRIISKKIIYRAKTVLLSEVKEALSADALHNLGNFCIDFGMGLVPVHVFKFQQDPDGVIWALFVRHDELERALVHEARSSFEFRIYQVPQDLLRQVDPIFSSSTKTFQWAKEHLGKLIARGETIIPDVLQVGVPASLPGGLSFEEIRGHLNEHLIRSTEVQTPNIFYLESSLVPLDENPD